MFGCHYLARIKDGDREWLINFGAVQSVNYLSRRKRMSIRFFGGGEGDVAVIRNYSRESFDLFCEFWSLYVQFREEQTPTSNHSEHSDEPSTEEERRRVLAPVLPASVED